MSTRPARRPVPRAIYWRRRFLVLAVILLLVWGVVQLWPNGSDDPKPAAAPTPSASASSASASPTSASSQAEQTDARVTLATSSQPCTPESVRMTPSVQAGQTARAAVRVEMLVSTTARRGCTLDPSETDLVAVITSGDTAVWDSSVCRSALLDKPVALSPGWATSVSSSWSGRGSGPTCSPKEGWVAPGTYRLRIGTLGGEPGTTTFRLGQPEPQPTPSPSASASGSASPSPSASPTPSAKPSGSPRPSASPTPSAG